MLRGELHNPGPDGNPLGSRLMSRLRVPPFGHPDGLLAALATVR
jgi:hypothetical protein